MTNMNQDQDQNQEVDFSQTVINVKSYLKQSAENILYVGRELQEAKNYAGSIKDAKENAIAKALYRNIYVDLPFGEVVGNKFIAIYDDKMIGQYLEYLPNSYNTLYDKLKGLSLPVWQKLVSPDGIYVKVKKGEDYTLRLNPLSTAGEIQFMLDDINNVKPKEKTKTKEEPVVIPAGEESVCVINVGVIANMVSTENIKKLNALQSTIEKLISDSGLSETVSFEMGMLEVDALKDVADKLSK